MNALIARSPQDSSPGARWFAGILLTVLAALSGGVVSFSADAPSTVPLVNLATGPLYARGGKAKPTLSLALSVEYPTVGAQYLGGTDYTAGTTYLGYFNPDLCYLYSPRNEQFNATAAASSHTCAGTGFSGNFMNWATGSAIDVLRLGLTGGDRIIDTADSTVLQRAVLPANFYNGGNFPSKSLQPADVAGALPAGLLSKSDGSVYGGTVYVANCLNQVFFGTAAEGSCGAPGNNANLGQLAIPGQNTISATKPDDSVQCATENQLCQLPSGPRLVYYGLAGFGFRVRTVYGDVSCKSTVFGGDPAPGRVKACYYATDILQTVTGDDGSKSGTSYFLTRISVCASMTGATADVRMVNGAVRAFCTRYPNGDYKPTGDLQRYSDRVRISAFGYLMINTRDQYGGVLRAPMKYVGPTAYDRDFNLITGGNSQAEWDTSTGVFLANPMGETAAIPPRTTPISGVINYLNQFGRTGVDGAYKTIDPVNELYYETLRYLQGLQPTPQALLNLNDATRDGFPVYTTWTDPQPKISDLGNTGDYTCAANNILVIGDVHTHADKSLPGNTITDGDDFARPADPAGNMPDFGFWTKVAGGFEANQSVPYVDGAGVARNTLGSPVYNAAPNYSRGNLDTLAGADNGNWFMVGAAYWANTHDIRGLPYTGDNTNNAEAWANTQDLQRPGMRVRTYVIDVNETNSSTTLANRRNNQFFLAAKYGGFDSTVSLGGNPFVDASGAAKTLWERGSTGDPQDYFLASDAANVLNSLDEIFAQITADAASIAGTSTTSVVVTSATGGSSTGFQATFSPSSWSGDLYPFTISTDADNNVSLAPSKTSDTGGWSAAEQLTAAGWSTRNIVVGTDTSGYGTPALNFKSFSSLSSTQQAEITNSGLVDGQILVDYLRGDRSNESPASEGLRQRSSILGDIVNSGIVYKGAPVKTISDSGYSTFYADKKDRTAAVYVGANDGMLHAFDAATGDELFAYIPSFIVPKLNALATSTYVHQSYVDATPVVGEAQLGTTDTDWRTVLVGGTGGGGQGVYALDVTDPSAFATSKVLWEFTDKNDPDMGNVVGRPGIYKFRTNDPSVTPATYGWFAVVASGVNNYAEDGNVSSTGNPALFILDLSKSATTPWVLGTNYFKISFPQASTTIAMGMLNFSAIAPGGVVSRMYAGDLQGNLWALNFNKGESSWNFSGLNARAGSTPLFIAKTGDATPKLQPITTAPQITGYGNNLILVFGTGKYMDVVDNVGPFSTQSVYAVLDPVGLATAPDTLQRSSLHAMTVSAGAVTGAPFIWNAAANADTNTYAGWYFDASSSANTGERFVSNFAIYSGSIFANSIVPAAGGCAQGTSNSYLLGVFSGNGGFTSSNSGLLGSPLLVSVGTPVTGTNPNNGLPTQTVTIVPINPGSASLGKGASITKQIEIGVRSWREIFSYQSLKN